MLFLLYYDDLRVNNLSNFASFLKMGNCHEGNFHVCACVCVQVCVGVLVCVYMWVCVRACECVQLFTNIQLMLSAI